MHLHLGTKTLAGVESTLYTSAFYGYIQTQTDSHICM